MTRIQQLQQEFDAAQLNLISTRNRFAADPTGPLAAAAIETAMNTALNVKERLLTERGRVSQAADIARFTDGMVPTGTSASDGYDGDAHRGGSSIGAQILASEMGQWLLKNRGKFPSGAWTSPSSELMASTLTEDSASGGGVIVPQYLPGIQTSPTRPLVVAELIGQGVADSNAIVYMREKTWTNAAAATAEGALKPESAFTFEPITDLVRKIATFLPVSDELLEDLSAMASYLNQRLSLGVNLALDDELLNGSGTAPHLAGFLGLTGLATPVARGTMTNADAILTQIAAIQNSVFVPPDGVILNPVNWTAIELLKNANGNYISLLGPLSLPPVPSLWGVRVALSPQIPIGTALVGCFQTQAQLFRRGGLRVESTNSHSDYFQRDLVAVRAEIRAALAVYRTGAFGLVTGLT